MSHKTLTQETSQTIRGFALYVGLNDKALQEGIELAPHIQHLLGELQNRLTELDPTAKTYATVAVAPEKVRGQNLDIVRAALGEPEAKRQLASKRGRRKTGITIDFTRKQTFIDGDDAKLSFKEYSLLQFLVLREGLTISREQIAEHLANLGSSELAEGSRAIDVQIRRLRAKLEGYENIIRTVHGKGYRFDRHADVHIIHADRPSPDRV